MAPAASNKQSDPVWRRLPTEIWEKIIRHTVRKDVKQLRLASSFFRDLATPTLFEVAFFSIAPRNLSNTQQSCNNVELREHVRILEVEDSRWDHGLPGEPRSINRFADVASTYYAGILGAKQTQGPFSPSNLTEFIQRRRGANILPHQLSDTLKYDLVHAFILYQERLDVKIEEQDTRTTKIHLLRVFKKFKNVKRIVKHDLWPGLGSERIVRVLHGYLADHLSHSILEQIPGFDWVMVGRNLDSQPLSLQNYECFAVPGISARMMGPLDLPPRETGGTDLLWDLLKHKIKSEGLSLLEGNPLHEAAHVNIEDIVMSMAYDHDFVESHDDEPSLNHDILRQALKPLKRFDLNCEDVGFSHLFHRPNLRLAVQSMPDVENLSLAFWPEPKYPPLRNTAWGVLLFKVALKVPANDDDNMTESASQFSHSTLASAVTPPKMVSSYNNYRGLDPNPWPKLHTLRLAFMEATKDDFESLFYTLRDTLKSLVLHHVQLERKADEVAVSSGAIATNAPAPYRALTEDYITIIVILSHVLSLEKANIKLTFKDTKAVFDRLGLESWEVCDEWAEKLLEDWLIHGEGNEAQLCHFMKANAFEGLPW